jgi:hypothetical protein
MEILSAIGSLLLAIGITVLLVRIGGAFSSGKPTTARPGAPLRPQGPSEPEGSTEKPSAQEIGGSSAAGAAPGPAESDAPQP